VPIQYCASAAGKDQGRRIVRSRSISARQQFDTKESQRNQTHPVTAFGLIEMSVVDRLFHAEQRGFEVDVPPAQCQQLADPKSRDNQQENQ